MESEHGRYKRYGMIQNRKVSNIRTYIRNSFCLKKNINNKIHE